LINFTLSHKEVIFMKVRGTQNDVKTVDVNVDTVYIRSNITRIETNDFTGWEYDEQRFQIRDYIQNLANNVDTQSIAMLLSIIIGEVDTLRSRIEVLEGK